MGLKETVMNLFKSQETKKKEASAAREAAAEQVLQRVLSSPSTLKSLCSVLNTADSMKLLDVCNSKIPPNIQLPKASEIVGAAQFGSIENIANMRFKEQELAKKLRALQQLAVKAAKGDAHSKDTYPGMRQSFELAQKMHTFFQNGYSKGVLLLLQTAVLSGRVKNTDKLKELIKSAQVENHVRRVRLGLVASTQSTTAKRTGESR